MLTAIFITWLGYQLGKGQGWWGSVRSGGDPSTTTGTRTGSPGVRTSGPSRGGSSRGSGAVRGIGERIGRALGWRDAKRIHDRDQPPVTWGDAWREGVDAGRQRGRDRYDEGQQRKLERELQKQWLIDAKARSGDEPLAPRGLAGRWDDHVERVRTCPDCGHGNRWNDNRESCPCERDDCACGTDAAPIGRDDEDERPDLSQPLDDEQRWGPPGEADEPNDPAEKNPDSYRPQSPADPVAVVDDLGGTWSPNFDDYASGRVDGAQVICVLCRNAPCTCSKPPAPTGDEDQTDPEETPVSAPTAPTPSMSGEIVNFDSARDVLRGISAEMQNLSDAATETAAKHRGTVAACDAAIDGLSQIDSDPDTIGDFLALREQAMQALEAAEKAQVEAAESSSYATTVIGNIDQRHGAIEEAVRSAKHAAKIDAYKAS